jgi:hypothetical protein
MSDRRSRRSSVDTQGKRRPRGVAWLLSLLLLLVAASAATTPGVSGTGELHCPDHQVDFGDPQNYGKFEGVEDAADLVLASGTRFCVKQGNSNTGVLTADGIATLGSYLGGVGYYMIYPPEVQPDYELAWLTQPASTEVDTEVPGVGGGSPQVRVIEVVDGGATQDAAVSGASITLALSVPANLGAGSTMTVTTDAFGIATFTNVTVGVSGLDYTLTASATQIGPDSTVTPVTSSAFDVYVEDGLCAPGACDVEDLVIAGTEEDATLSITLGGVAGTGGGGFTAIPEGGGTGTAFACTPPPRTQINSIPVAFTVAGVGFEAGTKTLTIRISEEWDKANNPTNGVAHYQLCVQPQAPVTANSFFKDRYTGALVTGGLAPGDNVGYLPDCGRNVPVPCISSRSKDPLTSEPLLTVRWGSRFTFK